MIEAALTTTHVRARSTRFASLRAAQRALSDLAHPAELEQMIEQARRILIALQALSIRASEAAAGPRSPEQAADDGSALGEVDALLDEYSARTGEILDRKPMLQLRAHLRERSEEHPEETRGLIDVVLEGDVERDENLRFLEFLVTLLSSEECDTGRAVVREPGEVAPQIRAFAAERFDDRDPECVAAEQAICDAIEKLFETQAVGETRDRIRAYKRELGSRILHPRVLSAAVRYNVAMSNRVTGLVEGSLTIDRLADDLLDSPEAAEAPAPSTSIFDATGFARVVAALRARLLGEPPGDTPAAAVAAGVDLAALDAADVEAFETRGEDHTGFLLRAAIALGLIIRHEPRIVVELRQLEIDPALLAGDWLHELAREMTATARKLMAEARYAEASRISEMKVKHLAVASTTPKHRGGRARRVELAIPQPAATRGVRLDAPWVRALGLALGLAVFALMLAPLRGGEVARATGDFSELSPYLESGYRSAAGESARFVGTLVEGWERLDTSERLSEASRIGDGLRGQGVDDVVLLDHHATVQVRYRDGAILHVEPPGGAHEGRHGG